MLAALLALSSHAAPALAPRPVTYDPSRSLAPLVHAVGDAVVKIEIHGKRAASAALIPESPAPRIGEGSGFVVTADGYVLTNHHVVAGADEIVLGFSDGTLRSARMIGGDAALDIALLKIDDCKGLTYVTFGDSDALEVGDWVVAVGNGLGLGTTVTAGIVSAKGRSIAQDTAAHGDYIQTDAAINQGNSGGPLFGLDGRVVGMSAAVITGVNTVGFAIPSKVLVPVLDELKQHGRVARGFLGVQPRALDPDVRAERGIQTREGAMVATVYEDTPAARAGLRAGDVVVAVDGRPIDDDRALVAVISRLRPGDLVLLEVERDAQRETVTVTLGEATLR
jgi:serine protease Do